MSNAADGDLDRWWRLGLALLAPLASALFRVRIVGAERIPRGPAIVAANHVSPLDGIVLAFATARAGRRMTRFLVAAEFFRRKRFAWALRMYRQIPLRRGEGDADALREAIGTVSAGALAGIFPEGRVNPAPDEGLQRPHRGAARIALATGAPVVPVGLWGTQRRWPRDGLRFGRPLRPIVAVVYGPAVECAGSADSTDDVARCTSGIVAGIAEQVRAARPIVQSRSDRVSGGF